MLIIYDIDKQLEEAMRGGLFQYAALVIIPVHGMRVLNNINSTGPQDLKVINEGPENII